LLLKKIDIYIIKKFLGTFFYAILLLAVIIIIFDISERIDDFLEKSAPLKAIVFDYYLNFLPYFVNMFSALFTFIAVVFFTSRMASNTEIIAILNSGVSFWRILRPYLVSSVILTLLSFALMNYVIPHTNRSMREFEKRYIKNPFRVKDTNIHMQMDKETYIFVESYNNVSSIGYRFTMEKIDSLGLKYRFTSDMITWDSINKSWKANSYTIRFLGNRQERLLRGRVTDTTFNAPGKEALFTPSDFVIDIEDAKIMTYRQLSDYIKRETLRGNSTVMKFEVEKYKRIAFPFANIVLTFIGVALSSRKVRGGIGLNLGLGIGIAFTFILLLQVTSVFSVFGNLKPSLGLWIPNIIYGLVALFLLIRAPK